AKLGSEKGRATKVGSGSRTWVGCLRCLVLSGFDTEGLAGFWISLIRGLVRRGSNPGRGAGATGGAEDTRCWLARRFEIACIAKTPATAITTAAAIPATGSNHRCPVERPEEFCC